MPSIRRLVRSFGEYGLRDYCRDGSIPADQICAIVQVEPYTDDNDVADDTNNESDSNDS